VVRTWVVTGVVMVVVAAALAACGSGRPVGVASTIGISRTTAPPSSPPTSTMPTSSTTTLPPETLQATLLSEEPVPDLQPVGTPVPAANVTAKTIVSPNASFGLATFASLNEATYPALSTDGGTSWHVDGPEFYVAAAQGPAVVSSVGALPPDGAYMWGQGGNVVRITTDGGTQWWATGFAGGVYSVTASSGTIDTVALGTQLADGAFSAYLYASTDYGHSWQFQKQVANVRL